LARKKASENLRGFSPFYTKIKKCAFIFCENKSDHEGLGAHRRNPAEIFVCFIPMARWPEKVTRETALFHTNKRAVNATNISVYFPLLS
jgi:hypothetical protein